MAPKKQQKQKNTSRTQSSSSSAAPKLHLSAENEQRLRRLLLNDISASAAAPVSNESVSLSKVQKAKKLKSIYEKLSCEGFSDDLIERALSALKDNATFESALDWLCLNLPRSELPLKFSDGSSQHTGGSVGIISTAKENWSSLMDTSVRSVDEACGFSVRIKGQGNGDSLDLHEPSQADWIRQYMEKEEEIEPGTWEDNLSDEGPTEKVVELRSYDSIVKDYQAARLQAIIAKESGDKKSQEVASNTIRTLKHELFALGLSEDMLASAFTNVEVTSTLSKEGNLGNTKCCSTSESLSSTIHYSSEDIPIGSSSIAVEDEAGLEGESGDIELGDFFLEGDPSAEVLPPDVLKIQKNDKRRGLPSGKTLEALEGIWKKGDPQRIPKAVLHQLCQRSGWDPPRFNKVGSRGNGFSYTVSVLRKSSGRGKGRKTGGLITLQLPDQDKSFESAEEAQNRVAAFALHCLFPDLPIQLLITEPYSSLVTEWDEGESSSKIEETQEDRRHNFVNTLVDADFIVPMSSVDITGSPKEDFKSPYHEDLPAAPKGKRPSREKESFLLRRDLENKRNMPRYRNMLEARAALPVAKLKGEILSLLEENNVLVVCGETGSGKTTQVPQYILDDMIDSGHGGHCNIICTQPRRIAAISVAERVADERCELGPGMDGSLVGYQVRLDTTRNDRTKLLFCTTGILLRKIAGNKDLAGVTHVVVDEVHERSLLGDFLLIVLKNLLEKQSVNGTPALKVILMSATVDSTLFSRYFDHCPVITAEGRTHPVSTFFLEDIYERINYRLPSDSPAYLGSDAFGYEVPVGPINNRRGKKNLTLSSWGDESLLSDECMNQHYIPSAYQPYSEQTRQNLKKLNEDVIDYDLLEDLVCHLDEHCGDGAILIFLPGISEIYKLLDKLAVSYRFAGESRDWLLPLHSSIAAAEQKKVFLQPPKNIRKVIMATNIAETSLTIDDVVYVIDSGKHKEYRYDPRKKLSMMAEDWISQANAKQRCGRAGRVKPGICFRLYTRHRFETLMRRFQVPEMLRMQLVELCLQIKLLSLGNIKSFLSKALEPPKEEAISSAVSLLKEVGAVDGNEELTPLGCHLAKLPVDLLLGKMMLYGAMFGCLSPILSISAFLSYKSPFVYPKDEREFVERSKLALLSDKLDGSRDTSDGDRQSDHIVMMVAYSKWEKILREKGVKAAQKFCGSYSLSISVMFMIRDMRVQLGTLLADIGLISLPKYHQKEIYGTKKQNLDSWFSDMSQPFNKYAHHFPVVKAILCAGLYPNIAATVEGIHEPTLGSLRQSLRPMTKGYPAWYDGRREVHIHPSSVNSYLRAFQHPFLVFLEKVETNKVFLRDTTIISPYSLLLFGGSVSLQHQIGMIMVDDWLKIAAPAQTSVLFKELRLTLQSILHDLISKPERAAVDNEVVKSIIHLLLEENKSLQSRSTTVSKVVPNNTKTVNLPG